MHLMDFRTPEIQNLPKVELHLHLDCSLSFDFVSWADPNITLSDYEEEFIAPPKCHDLVDFLSRAPRGISLMQTREQLVRAVRDVFAQLKRDHIIYAEIRFAPLEHTKHGLTANEVVSIVNQQVNNSIEANQIEANIILCTLRHYSEVQSLKVVELVYKNRGTHVVGFDIAGDEAGYPIDAHISAYQYAIKHQIPCTAHAGEAKGPKSVYETLSNFGPSRIGHGVRSAENHELLDYLYANNIHLEICPTSNVQTNIYSKFEDHAIDQLYKKGLLLSINTDARTISNITLNEEYAKLSTFFSWSVSEFYKCNQMALSAAFISEPLRNQLSKKLHEGYSKYLKIK